MSSLLGLLNLIISVLRCSCDMTVPVALVLFRLVSSCMRLSGSHRAAISAGCTVEQCRLTSRNRTLSMKFAGSCPFKLLTSRHFVLVQCPKGLLLLRKSCRTLLSMWHTGITSGDPFWLRRCTVMVVV